MATENLKVKITADASQAKAEIGKFKNSMKSAETSSVASLGKIAVAAAAVAVAFKAMKATIQNAIDVAAVGDAIKDNAQKVFMSNTAYQEWGYVLKQNGIEIGALKVGMRKFAQEVAGGSDALKKYGITATNVEDAFGQAVTAIQNMESETEKVAAATELFGTRALELMPILNMTNQETQNLMATYRAMGATMSDELIAASDVCTDSITAMKAAWGGLKNLLASAIIPVITAIVQWITVAIVRIRMLLKSILGIKESFGGGGNKKKSIAGTTASTAKNTGGTAKNLGKAAKHAKELRKTLMGIDELTKLVEQATSSGGGGGGGGGIGDIGGLDLGDLEGAAGGAAILEDVMGRLKNIEVPQALIDALQHLKEAFLGYFEVMKEWGLWVYENVLKPVGNWLVSSALPPVIDAIASAIEAVTAVVKILAQILEPLWEPVIKPMFKFLGDVAVVALQSLATNLKNFATALSWVAEKLEPVSKTLKTVSDAWVALKNNAGSFTATATLKLSDAFTSAWNKVKTAWNNIKNKTVSIGINFKNALSSKWNSLAKKVNNARSKYKFLRSILPQMPYLAKGGILTSPTAAVMGEYAGARQNPEIATPQSLMYETIQRANGDLVSAFAVMTRQVIAAIEAKDLEVKIGDEQIARSAQRGNTAYYNRTGKALLTV